MRVEINTWDSYFSKKNGELYIDPKITRVMHSVREQHNLFDLIEYHSAMNDKQKRKYLSRINRRVKRKNRKRKNFTEKERGIFIKLLFDRDGKHCQRCEETKDLTIDHIFPLSAGGENDMSNFQILCRKCNSSKGTNSTDYRNKK